jgi:hypothetical protein
LKDKLVVFEIVPEQCMDVTNGFRSLALQTGASNAANITRAELFVLGSYEGASARRPIRTSRGAKRRRQRDWRDLLVALARTDAPKPSTIGGRFAHSRNSDLPAVRISNDDAYIVGV